MNYTIYKTTNLINGKFYIGMHKTKNPNDSYLGSGTVIKKAIEKYGKENFKKEILFCFDNEQEMIDKEKELITEEQINDTMCYNMTLGGIGSWSHVDSTGDKNCMKRHDVALRVSKSLKKRIQNDDNLKQKLLENAKKASMVAAEKRKGSRDNEETKKKRVDTRLKTLRARPPKFKITLPCGTIHLTPSLGMYANENNMSLSLFRRFLDKGKIKTNSTLNTEKINNSIDIIVETIKTKE